VKDADLLNIMNLEFSLYIYENFKPVMKRIGFGSIAVGLGLFSILFLQTSCKKSSSLPDDPPIISDTLSCSIAVISDIHMGDARASAGKYCWFGKNADALSSFLDYIQNQYQVRQLVIQGDLFDEWLIPYRVKPYDPAYGINNTRDFYLAVANAPVNQPIVQRLKAIAAGSRTELIYIPGNHDMLMTRQILEEIIPGIIWAGDVAGLGRYIPVSNIVMEHGHRYDFFCCPQPLVNPGHMLPPGYFVSRLYADGMQQTGGRSAELSPEKSSLLFLVAWAGSFIYIVRTFNVPAPPMDSTVVQMTGADNYNNPVSFFGMQDIYNANIEELWPATQVQNGVPVPVPVLVALINGVYLTPSAIIEYLQKSSGFGNFNIVSFGHSHSADITAYLDTNKVKKLYVNSGTWIDDDQCTPKKSRTFLILRPAKWTGSGYDKVMLYQFNPSGSGNNGFSPVLITKDSVATL